MLLYLLGLLGAIVLFVLWFVRLPMFGKTPSGAYLAMLKQSPQYRNGKFQNQSPTPDITEGVGYGQVLWSFLFEKSKRLKPLSTLPSQKTNLHTLSPQENVLVWFGHSSYFIQVDGKRILVDPVFSGNASPIPGSMKSFLGSDVYTVNDIPEIDFLFLSHDHWDHLDYETIIALQLKIKLIITGLGTALHLRHWGFSSSLVLEKDWFATFELAPGFVVNTLPARHFSGRGLLKRQQSLWMSFALKTPSMNLFIGGDSGYDSHFKAIGKQFGPFDWAILECGQYNKNWRYIHAMPDEVVRAAFDLKAKKLLPVHWAKFPLAQHDWDEPIIQVIEQAHAAQMPIATPMIGEKVNLDDATQMFQPWWKVVV